MPYQWEDYQRSTALRSIARVLLRRAETIGDREQKRRLDRQAFALVQEATALRPPGLRGKRRRSILQRSLRGR